MKQVIILLLLSASLYAQEGKVVERWECRNKGDSWDNVAFTAVVYEDKESGQVSAGGVLVEETNFVSTGLNRSWVSCNEGKGGFVLVIVPGGSGGYVFLDEGCVRDEAAYWELVCRMK